MTSRHCQHCGAALAALTFEDGRKREQCLACGTAIDEWFYGVIRDALAHWQPAKR